MYRIALVINSTYQSAQNNLYRLVKMSPDLFNTDFRGEEVLKFLHFLYVKLRFIKTYRGKITKILSAGGVVTWA